MLAGMNVARFNFSHGEHKEHKMRMDLVKKISHELGIPINIMLDTKGPEIRTGLVEDNGVIVFNKGDAVLVTADDTRTAPFKSAREPGRIALSLKNIALMVTPGVRILIADGLLELEVASTDGATVSCTALNSAKIGSRKNVNLVGVHSGLPIIGEQDKADLAFGAEQNIDCISASFVSYPHEITEIRDFLHSIKFDAKIIAKIESGEGLENIEKIAALADGIMVARGDLAVQIPDEDIPLAQKHIIEAARRHCKPVITATQMLDSMIINPRPTRAELTDVANAIFDGTDALMLSGETANGAYPLEAVKTMAKICETVEQSDAFKRHIRDTLPSLLNAQEGALRYPHRRITDRGNFSEAQDMAQVVSRNAYETARAVRAKAIITPTLSGTTTRHISVYRPEQPVLAVTPDERTMRALVLEWGVIPKLTTLAADSDQMIQNALKIAAESGLADMSDKVVLAAGLPLHSPQPLNTVRILIIGNVLARSASGGHADGDIERASGRIIWAASALDARQIIKTSGGEILVCPVLTDDYIPLLRIVNGVICEGHCKIADDILAMINPRLVWLNGVHNASRKLESGLSVTIDGKAFLVYEGTI
jgi:pyruvate kinase